ARLAAQEMRVRCCLATGQYTRGIAVGLAALGEQGIGVPDTEEGCRVAFEQESTELDQWLEREPHGFDPMPLDPSLEHQLIDALMAQMLICGAVGGRPMLALHGLTRTVSESRRRGALTPIAPYMIGAFAQLWSSTTGMYRRAARWVEPGVRAAE